VLRISRKLQRTWAVYRDLGLAAAASRLVRKVRHLFGWDDGAYANWLAQKAKTDEDFDATYGVQTGGVQELFGYTISGSNARYGLSHIASDPDEFTKLLASLEIEASHHTFIDLGAGKGRALILAAQLSFRRIIGVEFAAELVEIAKANVGRLALARPAYRRIEVICTDACEYRFPEEPMVIYLFNPFGSAVVRGVAENLMASWRQKPRSILVLYMNAVHLKEFHLAGWRLKSDNGVCAMLVPDR